MRTGKLPTANRDPAISTSEQGAATIDAALDLILKAAGTRLSNYMPSTQAALRLAMASVLKDARADLVTALWNARCSLRAFGGELAHLSETDVERNGADKMQWVLLRQIDAALSKAGAQS